MFSRINRAFNATAPKNKYRTVNTSYRSNTNHVPALDSQQKYRQSPQQDTLSRVRQAFNATATKNMYRNFYNFRKTNTNHVPALASQQKWYRNKWWTNQYVKKIGLATAVVGGAALALQKIKQAITYMEMLHLSEEQLEELLKNKKKAAIITQVAAQNLNTLAKSFSGIELLENIMKYYPEAAQIFTQRAAQIFNTLAKSYSGIKLLGNIIEYYPEAAKTFAPLADQNFNTLVNINWGPGLLENIMKNYPEAVQIFTQRAAQNFNTLAKSLSGIELLKDIMKHNSEAAQIFTQRAAQNLNTLAKSFSGIELLKDIMKHNSEAAQIFTQLAAQNIQEIDPILLKTLIEKNPHSSEIKEALENLISNENKASNSSNVIKKVLKYFTDILTPIEQYRLANVTIKKLLYKKYFTDNPSLTPTEQHMVANIMAFSDSENGLALLNNPTFQDLYMQIIEKERELKNQGYYTFVHGQRWEYQLAQQWFGRLWTLNKEQPIQDYVFPHLKQGAIQADLDNEQKIREQLLKHGECLICPETSARQKVLFMNCPLFGNTTRPGCSSAHYFANNKSEHSIHASLKDVFHLYGYSSSYYKKYKNELEELEQEHKNLSKTGNMLLIAIPKDKLKDCVYLCGASGGKQSINVPNIGETYDIETIMNTLHTNPEKLEDSDGLQFCMPMTADLTLNPYGGIKISSFNAADKEKFAAFNKKSDALFDEIKQDIEQDRHSTIN